jgi:creatine kinase
MSKEERLKFEDHMVHVFETFGIPGKYYSLTPGHKNHISEEVANKLIDEHFLFADMTTDPHLTSAGASSDWPHGRGIWLSEDKTKMIWVGEEDLLRIISIVHGSDLGKVDASLH